MQSSQGQRDGIVSQTTAKNYLVNYGYICRRLHNILIMWFNWCT